MRPALFVALFSLLACEPRPAAVLEVQDPDGVASEATHVLIGAAETEPERREVSGFPFTVTLWNNNPGSPRVWVYALDATGHRVAYATGVIKLNSNIGERLKVSLLPACDASRTDSSACIMPTEPDTPAVCVAGECLTSACGDGWLDPRIGEICDDGNTIDGDSCSADCREGALVAQLSGVPNRPSNVAELSVAVSGVGVVAYRYDHFSGVADCANVHDSEFTPIEKPLRLTLLGEGEQTLCVVGKGADGREQTVATTQIWRFDRTPPVVTLSEPSETSPDDELVSLSGGCESGLTVTLDGEALQRTVEVPCDGEFSTDAEVTTELDGHLTLRASQVDAAGNIGVSAIRLTVDRVPPSAPGVALSFNLDPNDRQFAVLEWSSAAENQGVEIERQEVLLFAHDNAACSGAHHFLAHVSPTATQYRWDRLSGDVGGVVRFKVRAWDTLGRSVDSPCSDTIALRNGLVTIAGPVDRTFVGTIEDLTVDLNADGFDDLVMTEAQRIGDIQRHVSFLLSGALPRKEPVLVSLTTAGFPDFIPWGDGLVVSERGDAPNTKDLFTVVGRRDWAQSDELATVVPPDRYSFRPGYDHLWVQDFDGDGVDDLGVQMEKNGSVGFALFSSMASSELGVDERAWWVADADWLHPPSIGDMNGDGALDLVFLSPETLVVIPGGTQRPPAGELQPTVQLPELPRGYFLDGLNDLNRDGLDDLVLRGEDALFFIPGRTSWPADQALGDVATVIFEDTELWRYRRVAELVDLDGQDGADLVFQFQNDLWVLPANADFAAGLPADPVRHHRYSGAFTAVYPQVADITGDGVSDLILGGRSHVAVLHSTGGVLPPSGPYGDRLLVYSFENTLLEIGGRDRYALPVDFDGDAVTDLLFRAQEVYDPTRRQFVSPFTRVLLGRSTLPPSGPIQSSSGVYTYRFDTEGKFINPVDLNHDGAVELVRLTATELELMRAEAASKEVLPLPIDPGPLNHNTFLQPRSVDLTGDGIDELALSLPKAEDGAGCVLFISIVPNPSVRAVCADRPGSGLTLRDITADFDGDGRGDLVASTTGTPHSEVFIIYGEPSTDRLHLTPILSSRWSSLERLVGHAELSAIDLTADGAPDLVYPAISGGATLDLGAPLHRGGVIVLQNRFLPRHRH